MVRLVEGGREGGEGRRRRGKGVVDQLEL